MKYMWAETFFKDKVLLGIKSTQHSEGTNALLQKYFDCNIVLQDLVFHYEICVR